MPDSRGATIPEPHPEAVIAGTLCLMSCYVQHPVALYAERVADNLNRMAHFTNLSPELRTICRRLADRWEHIRSAAHERAIAGVPACDERALH
jgi:hypothetical protein